MRETSSTRRAAAALAATALTTLGVVAATSRPAGAAAAWVPTGTRALRLVHATPLGAPSPTRALRLTIGLAPRDRAGLDALIRRQNTPGSADYGRVLTPAQFTARFAATAATATSVRGYLRAQGMRNVTVASNRLQVTALSTVAQAEHAFHTSIRRYRQSGRTVLANTRPALVPATLRGAVTGVLGLSTLGFRTAAPIGLPKLTGYFPREFVKVYDAGRTKQGAGTTLAVFADGALTQTIKDLRLAEARRHLPRVPVSLVHAGPRSRDTSGVDEWNLDTQTSTGAAPYASRLYVYVSTSLTNADLARAINRWAAQDVARSGSASLGECDALPFLDGSMAVDDIALAEAAAQGQTFFASTGDTGSACAVAPTNGVPGAGLPDTEYPASSRYAVAVGGTTLDTDAKDNYVREIAWNAGGGGASPVENGGYWQRGVVPTAAADVRGLPDIALDADPNTGALIYVRGKVTQIGGTSLSSPLALGLWTRLQSSHGNRLGFAAPKLYRLYTKAQGSTAPVPPRSVRGFPDIIVGGNGAYAATPGWDYTTGLGSFDVDALSAALGRRPAG
ncbi:MAG: S53 family peptidase [Jatrophihabitantaceae bacterium]